MARAAELFAPADRIASICGMCWADRETANGGGGAGNTMPLINAPLPIYNYNATSAPALPATLSLDASDHRARSLFRVARYVIVTSRSVITLALAAVSEPFLS